MGPLESQKSAPYAARPTAATPASTLARRAHLVQRRLEVHSSAREADYAAEREGGSVAGDRPAERTHSQRLAPPGQPMEDETRAGEQHQEFREAQTDRQGRVGRHILE